MYLHEKIVVEYGVMMVKWSLESKNYETIYTCNNYDICTILMVLWIIGMDTYLTFVFFKIVISRVMVKGEQD